MDESLEQAHSTSKVIPQSPDDATGGPVSSRLFLDKRFSTAISTVSARGRCWRREPPSRVRPVTSRWELFQRHAEWPARQLLSSSTTATMTKGRTGDARGRWSPTRATDQLTGPRRDDDDRHRRRQALLRSRLHSRCMTATSFCTLPKREQMNRRQFPAGQRTPLVLAPVVMARQARAGADRSHARRQPSTHRPCPQRARTEWISRC